MVRYTFQTVRKVYHLVDLNPKEFVKKWTLNIPTQLQTSLLYDTALQSPQSTEKAT